MINTIPISPGKGAKASLFTTTKGQSMFNNFFKSATPERLTYPSHTQISVEDVLLELPITIVKLSAVTAIHYQHGKTQIHLKGGKFVDFQQSLEEHATLVLAYKTKLQETLPNR